MRRWVGIASIVAGLLLIGFMVTEHVYARSNDAQTVADHYRGLMSVEGLHDLRSGFDATKAAGAQLDTQAEPALQASLHMTPQQFASYKAQQMPGIAAFDANAPTVVAIVDPVITQMQAEQHDYHQADQIPTSWLPMTVAPWAFLAFGLALIAGGVLILTRRSRWPLVAVGGLGLVMVIAPLVVGIPSKVDAAQRVTKIGAVGLAPATGQKAVAATKLFDNMAADVHNKVEPALGAQFAQQYPALASWTDSWQESISAQSHALSDSQVALSSTFASANRLPIAPIPWLFIGSGALLVLLAAAALLPLRRTAAAPTPALTPIAAPGS